MRILCDCPPEPWIDCPRCNGEVAEKYWRPSDDNGQAIPPCMLPADVEQAS